MAGMTLAKLLEERLGLKTRPVINSQTAVVNIAATKIAADNPNRVALTVINLSAIQEYLMIDNQVSATRGIELDSNGGNLALNWEYDFELVSHEWWATAAADGSAVLVIEVVTV